jgi:dihydroorotate dehydrogenase
VKPYNLLFDHVLARTDPEQAHHAAFRAIRTAKPLVKGLDRLNRRHHVEVLGLNIPGVLGLAAGFDKNAEGIDALAALGFGFIEIGTVTGEPQPGNPRPRLVRLPKDRAVVNRMGFNNDGAEVIARRLAQWAMSSGERRPVLGVNIGKTKVVPEDEERAVIGDYLKSTTLLAPYADYLVVNVSSPNTPGLRNLQAVAKLEPLLEAVRQRADEVAARHVPLFVKIAPDLGDDEVVDLAGLSVSLRLDGIVATNTTISRSGLRSTGAEVDAAGQGGLSGAPLKARSLEVLTLLRQKVGPEMVLMSVGGIATPQDAIQRLDAGADLLQAYTAFIYEGPLWPSRMNRAISKEQASR